MLERLIEVQPTMDVAFNNLAMLYAVDGPNQNLNRALELADRFKRSEVPIFLDTLGYVNLKAGQLNNAIYFLEAAVERAPVNGEMRYHLGQAYQAADREAAAQAEFALAIEDTRFEQADWFAPLKTQLIEQ